MDLPVGQRPYDRPKAVPLDAPNNPVDEDGVVVYERDGQRHSHPTVLETYVLAMINGHRLHPDEPEYLRRARANADELLEHAVRPPGEVWLSYTFGFDVFGNPAEHLAAPWHSGMAQGRALLVFHSLAEIEPSAQLRARWLAAADAVYATTFRERRPGERWFRFSDDDGYVWFEEYPSVAEPPRVLNGHNSATIGYWKRALATGDPEARRLFDAGATTARHYAEVLRRPGDYSAYSVRTPVQSAYYHEMHTTQLRELAAMTGDPGFEELARQYEADLEAATARRSQ